jgi:hypothetical protein
MDVIGVRDISEVLKWLADQKLVTKTPVETDLKIVG